MKYAVKLFSVLCVCFGLAFCVGCAGSSPEPSADTPVVQQEAEPVSDFVLPAVAEPAVAEPAAVEPEPEVDEAGESADVADEHEADN